MHPINKSCLIIVAFALIAGCDTGQSNQMNEPTLQVSDLDNVVSVTVSWKKTHSNSNQVFRDVDG